MVKQYLDYAGLTELVAKIKELVTDAGHIVFKGAVADVAHLPTLDSTQEVGFMYTILAEGQTTADFTDGAGLFIAANSEVAVVEVDVSGTPTKKWVLLGPIFDVADKLTFGLTMPASPADGDTFLYLGDTTYVYTPVTPEGTEDPAALGWYHSTDGETWTAATEHTPDTTTYQYATRAEQYVQGVIYVYDDTTSAWVAKTAGDTIEGIPVSAVDALFD